MRIIINADDLGLNKDVNSAIFALLDARRVTSTSILANGPTFPAAAREICNYPTCSVGIHLNLTEFTPLTASTALHIILDSAGRFVKNRIRNVPISSQLQRAIAREFEEQISRLISSGIAVSHIDSHHHVHTHPKLFLTVKRMARRFNIPSVRISRNLYSKHHPVSRLLLTKKALLAAAFRHLPPRLCTTDGLADLLTFHERGLDLQNTSSTFEIMVHPGHPEFKRETALLWSDWLGSLKLSPSLITYTDLATRQKGSR